MTEELKPEVMADIQPFTGAELAQPQAMPPAGQTMQRIQTQYTTAVKVQQPRTMERVVKNVLTEAHLAGAGFFYRWEVKNRKTGRKSVVRGGSIDLAMACARNFGNCAVDIEVDETESHYLFTSTFIDIESGLTVRRLFRQRKAQGIGGGFDAERQADIVFQIGQSKAQRNAINKAMPGWLIEKAIEAARAAEISKVTPDNIVETRARLLDWFEQYGVSQQQIEIYCGCPIGQVTAAQIADLKAVATAINEGRQDPREIFQQTEPQTTEAKPAAPAEKPAPKTRPPAKSNAPAKKAAPGHRYPDQTPAEHQIQAWSEQLSGLINGLPIEKDLRLYNAYWDHLLRTGVKPESFYPMAIDSFPNFCKSAEKWADATQWGQPQDEPRGPLGDNDPPPDAEPAATDDDAFRAEWVRLRGGFKEYVLENLDRFKNSSRELQKEARAKWLRMKNINDSWPLDRETQPQADQNAQQAENSTQAADAGQGPPETETAKLSTFDAQSFRQTFGNIDGNAAADDDIFATAQWQECVQLYADHPDIYSAVRAELDIPNSKLTIESLQQIIDTIKQRVGA